MTTTSRCRPLRKCSSAAVQRWRNAETKISNLVPASTHVRETIKNRFFSDNPTVTVLENEVLEKKNNGLFVCMIGIR